MTSKRKKTEKTTVEIPSSQNTIELAYKKPRIKVEEKKNGEDDKKCPTLEERILKELELLHILREEISEMRKEVATLKALKGGIDQLLGLALQPLEEDSLEDK